jgi:glycosyltransferase involved in cell wall biosynthesis
VLRFLAQLDADVDRHHALKAGADLARAAADDGLIDWEEHSLTSLAAAIDELAGDAKRRVALGAAARAAAQRRFSPDRMAAEFREVYLG